MLGETVHLLGNLQTRHAVVSALSLHLVSLTECPAQIKCLHVCSRGALNTSGARVGDQSVTYGIHQVPGSLQAPHEVSSLSPLFPALTQKYFTAWAPERPPLGR